MEAQIFAWMMDIFLIFTLHILSRQILGVKYQSRLPLVLGWNIYFVLWNISSYLSMGNALVSNISTSVIYFLVLYFLYNGNVRNKLILTSVVVTLGIVAEGIVAFALTISGTLSDEYSVQLIVLGLLLIINIFTYYIFQRIQGHAAERMENELLKQQNELLRLRYEEFENQWLKLRRIRHDMANSCALEMSYLEKGQYEQLMEHYHEKLGQIKQRGDVIYTGNIGIDSVLNYKLEIAREHGIEVDRKIKIESEITISNIDLNILIGNLFDNAIEAVKELSPNRRKIRFFIRTNAARLLFVICNPYEREIKRDKAGNFLTSKEDDLYHGLGLKEVEEIVKKYDGEMNINDADGEFSVKVFLYINQ